MAISGTPPLKVQCRLGKVLSIARKTSSLIILVLIHPPSFFMILFLSFDAMDFHLPLSDFTFSFPIPAPLPSLHIRSPFLRPLPRSHRKNSGFDVLWELAQRTAAYLFANHIGISYFPPHYQTEWLSWHEVAHMK